jgi:hypothetical protein
MEPSWLETYYAALEFVYWEPQHLGRRKNPAAEMDSIDKVRMRLRRLEVTLNHNLDQFLRLAPVGLRNTLFAKAFGRPFPPGVWLHGRGVDSDFGLNGVMQPDFLFESQTDVVSIEMKIGSTSTTSQALKYVLLGLAVEAKRAAPRDHYLLMLGTGDFTSLWHERFSTVADLKTALSACDANEFFGTRPVAFQVNAARFSEIAQHIHVAFLTYGQLADVLCAASPPDSDSSPGAEVYRKLLAGMLGELTLSSLW